VNITKWDLPEEEGNRLIYYFLSECCINTAQALSDVLGPDEASLLWEPYSLLACKAYYQNRIEENRFPRLLDNKDTLLTIGVFLQHYFRAILGGKCKNMIASDQSLTLSVSDLQPPDMPPDFLYTIYKPGPGFAGAIHPQYKQSGHLSAEEPGQNIVLVKRKDDTVTTIGNKGTPRLCILPLKIDASEIDFWKRHYWGEFWRQGASMLAEEFGAERASQIVEPYMKQIGHFYGDYFKNRFEFKNRNPQEAGEVMLLLNRLLKQEGRIGKHEDDAVSCEITSCPFSNSSPFLCRQIEMIFNSICQAISPELQFKYSKMMTAGDRSCMWSVTKNEVPKVRN
jgi:hypothetical protein